MNIVTHSDDDLFKKTLRFSLGFYLLAAALVTIIHLPLPEHPDIQDLPERVAKLILEPSPIVVTPEKPKVAEPQEKKAAEKPKGDKKPAAAPKPSAQQTREIVKQSGLLASLIEEEEKGGLSDIIENQRLDQALSTADLITAPTTKTSRSVASKPVFRDTGLVDKTVAKSKTLGSGDRTKLAQGERVALARIPSGTGTGGAGTGGRGLGDGVGIRLKGGRSGSGTGSIDYDAIARVVEQYKNGLIYLYNKELRSNPTLKGTISVEFSIDSTGKVIDTRIVSTTMDHAPLEQALASRIKMWKFPHLYDGVIIVTYPFVFFPV